MEGINIVEVILYAAGVTARLAWASKASSCIVRKGPKHLGKTPVFQRRKICHEIKGNKIFLWKDVEEKRRFMIILPGDNLSLDDKNNICNELKKAARLAEEAARIGARLWDDEAIIGDYQGVESNFADDRYRNSIASPIRIPIDMRGLPSAFRRHTCFNNTTSLVIALIGESRLSWKDAKVWLLEEAEY